MKADLIQKLPVNKKGKDYIVGDLHGTFPLLVNFMKHVKFDVNKDRLISVGDLVDRGPMSFECLKLLKHDWFHSIKGNHEIMMYAHYFEPKSGEGYFWKQ